MEEPSEQATGDRPPLERGQDDRRGADRRGIDRRRLDEVFGDVLPATTGDERDERENADAGRGDEQLLADRPPHHDREH